MPPNANRLAQFFLVVSSVSVVLTIVCAMGWYLERRQEVSIEQLSSTQRAQLVQDLIAMSPGVYQHTWFAPDMGYTLVPKQEITAWNDTFMTNKFGYRTGPVYKPRDTFRVLFVGDSWTYGMGISEQESFPRQFQQIANATSKSPQRIESWTLALPGYNTYNQLEAFWFYYEQLKPDAVVICPTTNDSDTMIHVLPNGSITQNPSRQDQFDGDHSFRFPGLFVTYKERLRWRQVFEKLRETEKRLQKLKIPLMFYYIARWPDSAVFHYVNDAKLESPFIIEPMKYTFAPWELPPPIGHGNQAANHLYGKTVYQGLAQILNWPLLPMEAPLEEAPLYRSVPGGKNWQSELKKYFTDQTDFRHTFSKFEITL